ncbi:MAG: riboflavin synthase [Phycisphaerae bacterium]|nr:riboflavin synthase [Phycisphaerae bacterium]
MFTGIVERMGAVAGISPTDDGARLEIDAGGWPPNAAPGESISVDGCCLTLLRAEASRLRFDVVPQTLSRTTLGRWRIGWKANLERSATLATLLGGHLVQGHVDGVGRVIDAVSEAKERRVRIAAPPEVSAFLVPRGSVAVNGVSLTIAEVTEQWFDVALIPETIARTNLSTLRAGDEVNLEADSIAKLVDASVRRALANSPP